METIIINGNNENVISYLNKNSIASYRFLPNNKVENIGKEIYTYFDFLKDPPEEKKEYLPSIGEYKVILNKETKF